MLVSAKAWARGRYRYVVSPGSTKAISSTIWHTDMALACESTTPLGGPVVPEV